MIPKGEGWHYFALNKLSWITNLTNMKKYEEIKIFPNFVMPSEYTKMFEFNQYQKSDKAPLIIYANVK